MTENPIPHQPAVGGGSNTNTVHHGGSGRRAPLVGSVSAATALGGLLATLGG